MKEDCSICHFHLFTDSYGSMTNLQNDHSQLSCRTLHRYPEVMGSNPIEFRLSFPSCSIYVNDCDSNLVPRGGKMRDSGNEVAAIAALLLI